jgi:hypothetical protein
MKKKSDWRKGKWKMDIIAPERYETKNMKKPKLSLRQMFVDHALPEYISHEWAEALMRHAIQIEEQYTIVTTYRQCVKSIGARKNKKINQVVIWAKYNGYAYPELQIPVPLSFALPYYKAALAEADAKLAKLVEESKSILNETL